MNRCLKSRDILYLLLILLFLAVSPVFPVGQVDKAASIDDLKKKVAAIGRLAFKEDIAVKYMDKAQLNKYVAALFETEYPKELAEKEAQFLRLMGYVEKDALVNVRSIRKRIILDNAGGFYNEKTRELFALTQYRQVDYINSMLLVHELRHALQDQHYDVASKLNAYTRSDFDDRRLAVLAAFEGDATLLTLLYGDLDPQLLVATPSSNALMSFLPIAKPSLLMGKPEIFRSYLVMPYADGLRFLIAVYKKRSWRGIEQILKYPPASTEQVLHPEKYLEGEEPLTVAIQFQPKGYQLYHSGVVGEFFLNVLVKPIGDTGDKDYAQGWGGDTFHIYKNEASYFLAWESLWDKEINGSHFLSDLSRFLEKKYNIEFKTGEINRISFIAGRAAAKEDYFFLMRSKNKLFFARTDSREQMNAFIYGGNYD